MQPPANLPADYPGKPADRGSFVEIVTIALIATTLTTIAWRHFRSGTTDLFGFSVSEVAVMPFMSPSAIVQ